jgi:YVTN family beta-propeller protein
MVGNEPCALVHNTTNNKIYCANRLDYNVTVLDGAGDSVLTTITIGEEPCALVYNSTDNKIYCASWLGVIVVVIDGASDTVITVIAIDDPCALIYDSDFNKIYCADDWNDEVAVIDGATDSVITTIAVGNNPCSFTRNPVENRIYVANYNSISVSVIRDSLIGIEEHTQSASAFFLEIYPNPIKTLLTIHASTSLRGIKVYDILGNLVRTKDMTQYENRTTISVKHLSAGIYFLKVNTEDTEVISKVVVTK